ncbi:hypothetical protein HZF05_14550 [Sphingomonas sp. CGMCC 1.13654]|uniref:DUF2291 domain-containing protein n=1 Tax=Sphingomonas chungangi TaxID=2683589 RepID=A0A838L9B4_9SPHN|nr:hypothetical protein [Sphingomonas chungangi]MBA2935305.1 hypothetical protein [Sphingomonas chungangi]MVW56812.1 hypothetical protein [Sphingomonas chungangi]
MKRIAVVALLVLSLTAGCSRPKSTVIPSDPQKWDQLADSVKKLSDDDRKEFTAYMMRVSMASAFSGNKAIAVPPGTTIGDAISDQKKWEADQQAEEAKANILKAKVAAERSAAMKKLSDTATVALADLTVLPKNYDAGRFSDRLSFIYAVDNHTGKAISGIKGTVVFKDQFGADIERMGLSMDEDIAPNSSRAITGYGKDINQFEDNDTKLAVTPLSKMHVTFEPQMINFADGTSLTAPDGDPS